ncbi:dTDP-3,4-didehydro-2,6-dideoxy-alpha-D-glucose 3-reductase-like [Corticium candelabrum]|uniref:dTDP-3,4-didehydro-2,6-dideoxy-alpha-D-glucose 3-reductase-like n=1 Tax=Corticium candelabrum TaxID=121492 RepID=UPI002E255662|nr:dTDP-3,4-didehydro-2,6-dideoxy-alpha-D-glucose 3-reductase-like [Corticium candelabrum]
MSKSIRLALVGCGYIAQHHYNAILKCNGLAKVTAVVDVNDERTADYSSKTGAKAFKSLKDALTWGEFDAVDIMLPHHLHEEAAVECLEAGKHVLLEKPMAVSLAACRNVLAAAKRSGKVFMVCENAQYWPEVVKAKQLIEEEAIGDVYYAKAHYWESPAITDFDFDSWQYDPAQVGGGLLMAGSCHWIRPLRMWLGEIEEVIGITGNPLAHRIAANYETLADALLRFKNGKTASFTALIIDTTLSNQPYFRIFGSKGEITIGGTFKGGLTLYNDEFPDGKAFEPVHGYFASFPFTMMEFVQCVLGEKVPDVSPEYAVGEPMIMWAIYRSLSSKKWEAVGCVDMD